MATRNGKNGSVTIYDIATELGVGKTTVSLVLNGRGNISAATRAAVLAKARELGFQPNPHAQRLSNGRCDRSIFLFIENLYAGTFMDRAALIQHRLRERDFDVPMYTYGSGPPGDAAQLMASVCRQQPRAIVYQGQAGPGVVEALKHYVEMGGIAVCYTPTPTPPFDTVAFDYPGSGYQATRHLLQLGHREIGFYRASEDIRFYSGYRRAMEEAGLQPRSEWIFTGPALEEGGLALAEQFLKLKQSPTAICVINDAGASIFVNQIIRAGLNVPYDISIVSFDDTIQARTCIVPLTTVRQPVDEIAFAMSEMVLSRIGGYSGAARHQVICGQLIGRESSIARR